MLTITRKDLLLTIDSGIIPSMGSSNVPLKFVNDTETYVDFLIEPRVGYYVNGCPKSGICEYDTSSNIIKIPAEAFKNKGILVIAIALIDNKDSNHIEVTKELALEVTPAPNGTVILPATDTWQTAVKNLVEQLYNQDYKPQFDEIEENLHNLVKEAQNQQNKANNQQTQIDNAIDIMGDYEIVQDNPTQIRFKKGDGTYGGTVNLGDNLASKSMVNAGYDTYSGNSYSGSASDYGIEIGKASGNYEQVTTTGKNLFDINEINTIGSSLINNGNGSLTVKTGSTSSGVSSNMLLSEVCPTLEVGKTYTLQANSTGSNKFIYLSGINVSLYFGSPFTVTQSHLDSMILFYASGTDTSATISDIQIELGSVSTDYEPFTGGEPSPNPNYPQEPKFFEPKHVNTNGGNLFDASKIATKSQGGATITNNGDGSFTVSGSGTLSNTFFENYIYSNDEIKKLLKKGTLMIEDVGNTNPQFMIGLVPSNSDTFISNKRLDKSHKSITITDDDLLSSRLRISFYGETNTTINGGTIKPTLYQDGDGAWLPYNDDSTPLDITLRALPNGVCDTYENGVITRRVGVHEISTISSLNELQDGLKFFTQLISNKVYLQRDDGIICDKAVLTSSINVFENSIYENQANVVIVVSSEETLENVRKNFIGSKIYYELTTPITEQCNFPVIPSYFPYTNAWHDSEVEASELTWNILARQYGSGQTTIKKDEAVLTELDLNTERKANPTTVKVQLQDSEGKVLYLETSSENIYIQSGRFNGKTVQQVLENSIQAISATDEYIEVDVPDSMTQSIDEEFLVDEVDESETETE